MGFSPRERDFPAVVLRLARATGFERIDTLHAKPSEVSGVARRNDELMIDRRSGDQRVDEQLVETTSAR
jgi:hypothetical protein